MKVDFAALSLIADAAIKDAGQSATLVRLTAGTFNAATGKAATVETTSPITISVLPATSSKIASFEDAEGDGIKTVGSALFALASTVGLLFEPRIGDRLRFDGKDMRITGLNTLQPDGTAVIYQMRLHQ